MVYPAGNPLPLNPGGVPAAGNPTSYAPAAQHPAAGQPPVAVPPVAVPPAAVPPVAAPPQAWSPDSAQFSPQAIQAASAPQAQATGVPAANRQGYTQLWAEAPQTSLWEASWKTGPSVPVQPPPVVYVPMPQPTLPPVVQVPMPQPTLPPVVQAPVPQPAPPPVVQTPAPEPEPPKPDTSPSPVGSLPEAPAPEPAPVYPDPPNETPAPLGGLPDLAEPEPEPEPEPAPPASTASRLGPLPATEEPEPEAKPEPKPEAEAKPAPKPEPKPPAKAEGLSGRSWKVVADPHVTTGDGKRFDASMAGRFTLLRSADGKFEVQNTQGQIPGDRGIWNTAVTVKTHSDTVSYDAPGQALSVNGKKVAFKAGSKLKLSDGGRVEMTNSEYSPGKFAPRIQVVTPEGDRVAFLILQRKNGGRYVDLYGNVGSKRQPGDMSGMVGAFDADSKADNDLKLRDGKTASNLDAFLKDWKLD